MTKVRKSTLKSWNSDLFCNSAMKLILVILKMASGYPPGHLPSWEVHSKSEPHDVHMVMCTSKCRCLYLNSNCVYTSLYMHAPTFPCTYKNTCHFIRTLHITVSEEKEDTVPSKGQRTLKNINLLQFVKTAQNFQLWITKFMFLAKILTKYLTAKCSELISSVSMEVKCNSDSFQLLISHYGPQSFCTL